jgi:hypothetical protein
MILLLVWRHLLVNGRMQTESCVFFISSQRLHFNSQITCQPRLCAPRKTEHRVYAHAELHHGTMVTD